MNRVTLLLVLFSLGFALSSNAQTLTASDGDNDAYIEVDWIIPVSCLTAPGGSAYSKGVFVELLADGEMIYSEIIRQQVPMPDTSSFRHFIGPDQTRTYSLNLYVIGPGTLLVACSGATDAGNTLAFQPPTLVSATDSTQAGSVTLTWRNNSRLSSNFLIYRKTALDSQLIATIPGSTEDSTFTYIDGFRFNDTLSLENGVEYSYCVRTYSALIDSTFDENTFPGLCDPGSTYNILFSATDRTQPDRVQMQWRSVSAYADKLYIKRNGNIIAILDNPAQTTYTDLNPVYGYNSEYALELSKANVSVVQVVDTGSVAPIGLISGFVRTPEGYGAPGVNVTYSARIFDTTYTASTVTDYTGLYQFPDLFYGIESRFILKAKRGTSVITPDSLVLLMNNANARRSNANFVIQLDLKPASDTLSILRFDTLQGIDRLQFDWDFFSTADTTFFQVYRENRLIALWDNISGDTLNAPSLAEDLGGEPEFYYRYELRAYILSGNEVLTTSVRDTFRFPAVASPFNVVVSNNFDANSMGVLTTSWDHASANFDGFRLYRNDSLIAMLADTTRFFYDFAGQPGQTYTYAVSAFRIVNGVTHESARVSAAATLFPVLFEPQTVTAVAEPSENAVLVSWTIPAGQTNADNFTGFQVFRGTALIGEVLKGGANSFRDLWGIPGQTYTYTVKTFIEQSDTTYASLGGLATATFPTIAAPPALTATAGAGKVTVSWPDTYNATNDNFDGFIISAAGLRADTLKRHVTSYDFYSNTPGALNISLRAFRKVNGLLFQSPAQTTTGSPTLTSLPLEAPANVRASKEFPMHIAITWTYPVFKLSRFIIRRDGTPVDTLPPTARAFYDYGVQPGVSHEYYVQALFEAQLSNAVGARGVRRNVGSVQGQIVSEKNGRNVDSVLVHLLSGTTVLDQTFTTAGGFYLFDKLPLNPAQSNLNVGIDPNFRNIDIATPVKPIAPAPVVNTDAVADFQETFTPFPFPPNPRLDSVALIAGVAAQALSSEQGVLLSWTPNEGKFDGFEVWRDLTRVVVKNRGESMNFVDSLGGNGIQHNYFVRSFVDKVEERAFSDPGALQAVFPVLPPVANLTATPGYGDNDNSVVLNWSHLTGDVSFYQVDRNGDVLGLIPAGKHLKLEDAAGKPGQNYVYTVRPVKQAGRQLSQGDPRSVSLTYPLVGDPILQAAPLPDSNGVLLSWSYNGPYVSGFRVLREGTLIATLDNTATSYLDIEGLPGTVYRYQVLATLERDNMLFQSVGSEATTTFPPLAPVTNLSATQNTLRGLIDLMWEYPARGIDSFQLSYMVTSPIDTTVVFKIPKDTLVNGRFFAEDIFAVPGAVITYMVSALSWRENEMGIPTLFQSVEQQVTQTYPSPPTPSNVSATDGAFESHVEITWNTDEGANIDFFEVWRDGVKIAEVPKGLRHYADVFNDIGNNPSATFTYAVRSVNVAFNSPYYSGFGSDTGFAGLNRKVANNLPSGSDFYSQYGFSVAISGNNAVAGAPNEPLNGVYGVGRVSFYRFDPAQQTWQNPENFSETASMELGYSVSIDGDIAILGAPGSGASSDFGRVVFAERAFDNTPGNLTTAGINFSVLQGRYGQTVAIASSSTDVYFSEVGTSFTGPGTDQGYRYRRTGANAWAFVQTFDSSVKFRSLAAFGNFVAGGTGTEVRVYRRDPNSENLILIQIIPGELAGDEFGYSVDIAGDYLVVGARMKGAGVVYVYKYNGSTFSLIQTIQEPSKPGNKGNDDEFGASVSTDGVFIVVGAPGHFRDGDNYRDGMAFVFKLENDKFDYVDFIPRPDFNRTDANLFPGTFPTFRRFGHSVAASSEHILIGDPTFDFYKGKVYFYQTDLIELWSQKLLSASASDGTFRNQTRVEWNFAGNPKYIDGYHIYRDDVLIGSADPYQSFYFDPDGVPGQEYTYTVRVYVGKRESIGKSDKGYRQGNGTLEGKVISAVGGSPVPGTIITARAVVGGEIFEYRDTTGTDGRFFIGDAYYADTVATYTITAQFEDHEYVENPITETLSPDNSVKNTITFFDRTAFIIKGNVRLMDVACGIDSVRVRAVSTFTGGVKQTQEVYTNEEGAYSFVVKPSEPGLQSIALQIDSFHVKSFQGEMPRQDTIYHRFRVASGSTLFTTFANFPRSTVVDFEDTLRYVVPMFITTVCGQPAANASFDIEVSTMDGCYQEMFTTGANGRVNAKLPPLNDLIITVKGVTPLRTSNALIVDYLRSRPNQLNLLNVHINNFRDQYSPEELLDSVRQRLVYHVPPSIQLISGISRYICDNPDQPGLLTQGSIYSLNFRVTELFGTLNCTVGEGYLVINNGAAAADPRDTLRFNPANGLFGPSVFRAGAPNLVAPYRRGINIKYFSENDDYLAEVTIPVVIEGETNLPGSDIIVDVKDEDGTVKLPVVILRDPPGDESSSTLEEKSTIAKTYSVTNDFSAGIGVKAEFEGAFTKVGGWFEVDLLGGGGFTDADSWKLEATTVRTISTSGSADFVGPDADVIGGLGIATQYGITERLIYDSRGCPTNTLPFVRQQSFGITLNEIKTDWLFAVGQIKQFVREKAAQIEAVKAGTLVIEINRQPLPQNEAIRRLSVEKANWEEVLKYHQKTSLPHVMFCSETYDADVLEARFNKASGAKNLSLSLNSRVTEAKKAQRQFCNTIGTYTALDSFQLTTDPVIWTTTKADAYETAVASVSYYLDSLQLTEKEIKSNISGFVPGQGGLFPEIQNTTFSGGVEITRSATVTSSTSSSYTSFGFIDFSGAGGLYFKSGTSAGIFLQTSIEDNELKIGPQVKINWKIADDRGTETTNETTVSYKLSDNEPGDQFSVTAIKGRDPGHSPYFQTLGGRSSCPPEVGTIHRDQFDMKLYDPETQSTFDEMRLENLPADEPAVFYLQISNNSPFGELRDVGIYYDGTTNSNAAVITLEGQYLGGGNMEALALTFLPANQAIIVPVTLIPISGRYQYENIKLIMRQSCTDGDLFLYENPGEGFKRDTVTISAIYDSPCSDITIAAPGDDWIIKRRNPFVPESREQLLVELRDYDSSNEKLQRIELQVRRIGDFDNFTQGWRTIPTSQLDPNYVVTRDSLASYDAANFGPSQIPKFFYVWDITELYDEYPDGEYEIRAAVICGSSGQIYSNIIRGKIDRATIGLFAVTSPADNIWQAGDEISILVNKILACNRLSQMTFRVSDVTGGGNVVVPGTVGCFSSKLVFQPTDPTLSAFDDRLLLAEVYDLIDESGNIYVDTFRWSFRVIARDIFAGDRDLYTTLYQDSKGEVSTSLFSTTGASINYQMTQLTPAPWVTANPATGLIPGNSGKLVRFAIDAQTLPIGDTVATFLANSLELGGGVDTIRVHVKVVARPPYWVVDPSTFTSSMIIVANYEFTDALGIYSQDSMDIVSVWIDEEIRGVGRINAIGGNKYAASLLAYGNITDRGKPLEFRVWDASTGIEYDGHPTTRDTFFYQPNALVGTFLNPEILSINRASDRARYIPLNGGGRWTWFSVNSQEPDMRVSRVLRALTSARDGDVIKTGNRSAGFLPGSGWISTNGLNTIRPEDGYLIFLNGPNDTIRLTGVNAKFNPIPLAAGYNLIGYPLQDSVAINTALNVLGVGEGDNIRTVAQNPERFSFNMIAIYTNGAWLAPAGTAMNNLRPTFAYQIQVANDAVLTYPGAQAASLLGEPESDGPAGSRTQLRLSDPNLPETWTVDPARYPQNMIITAVLELNGRVVADSTALVGAFVNGECRGVARLRYLPELDRYLVTMFVYGNRTGEEVEIRLYDQRAERLYFNADYYSFRPNALMGTFARPDTLRNKIFRAEYDLSESWCAEDHEGRISLKSVEGLTPPFAVQWNDGSTDQTLDKLAPGQYWVTITGSKGQWFVDTVTVRNLEVALPAPVVDGAPSALCAGEPFQLQATSTQVGMRFRWYDAESNLIGEEAALTVTGLSESTTLQVVGEYRGCLSMATPVDLDIRAPRAEFTLSAPPVVHVGDTVRFQAVEPRPAYSYQWDFGDGNGSQEASPVHRYSAPGAYTVVLAVHDDVGCNDFFIRPEPVQVEALTAVPAPQTASFSMSASPNPFSTQLKAVLSIAKGGTYRLALLDNQGRPLWKDKHVLPPGIHDISLNFSDLHLPDGVYFLRLTGDGKQSVFVQVIRARP